MANRIRCRLLSNVLCSIGENLTPSHAALCAQRYCSNSKESFDFNKIIQSNRKSRSLDGLKTSQSRKVSQKSEKTAKKDTPETVTEDEEINAQLNSLQTEPPDFLTVLMDTSYTGFEVLDDKKISQFRDFLETMELKSVPSVGQILQKSMPKSQADKLKKWKESKTKELGGPEKFSKYQEETLDKGVGFHKCIEKYLLGETDFRADERAQVYLESVHGMLQEVEGVILVEERVNHPDMFYTGKLDCVATYRGKQCLIEWKTSAAYKPTLSSTYDYPMQVAAYLGALNKSKRLSRLNLPSLTSALVVVCYPDGQPATVLSMDASSCQKYWARWQERVFQYWLHCYIHHIEQH